MPELLEHMRLRVDPLKDAVGSPFCKADRLYLYLHAQKLCVEWWEHCNWNRRQHTKLAYSMRDKLVASVHVDSCDYVITF